MIEEKEFNRYYAIPANYTDSGRLFGGMVAARNAAETVIIAVMLGFIEIKLIPMSTIVRIIVMVLTILPTVIAAMIGIDGESLTQFIGHVVRYLKNKRKLHYRRAQNEQEC